MDYDFSMENYIPPLEVVYEPGFKSVAIRLGEYRIHLPQSVLRAVVIGRVDGMKRPRGLSDEEIQNGLQ